jgi:hypothetical protein
MSMKLSSFALVLLAAAASPALAAAGADPQETNLQTVRAVSGAPAPIRGHDALKLLALETDLSARDVRLVLTTEARDARYDFRSERDMARRFEDSLGAERFADLVAGRPIALNSPAVLEAARGMAVAASGGWRRDGQVAMVVFARP